MELLNRQMLEGDMPTGAMQEGQAGIYNPRVVPADPSADQFTGELP